MDLLARAAVTLVDAAKKLQTLQVTRYIGEVLDGIKHYEPYGLTAHPHAGSSALVMPVGGSSDATVCLVVADSRYRPTDLAEGDACLYNAAGRRVWLTATLVKLVGNVEASANVEAIGTVKASGYKTGVSTGVSSVVIVADDGKVLTFINGLLVNVGVPAP